MSEIADLERAKGRLEWRINDLVDELMADHLGPEPMVCAYHRYRMASEEFERLVRATLDREVGL